ncbi:uncharacterized protein LOC120342999 [Styela clava]
MHAKFIFREQLQKLAQSIDSNISKVKKRDEELNKLQNEFIIIKQWISANKVSVKSEYEVKIQQLKNIQQSVSNKLSDEGKNLQSDVKKYVGRIRHFVEDYPYSEMLSSEERKALLEQYSDALWIENYRNVTSIEIREKLQQIIEVCEPIFERLLQMSERERQKHPSTITPVK